MGAAVSGGQMLHGLRQVIDLVRCHVDLNGIADAVELPIGNLDEVAADPKKASNFHTDTDLSAGPLDALNGAKVVAIR